MGAVAVNDWAIEGGWFWVVVGGSVLAEKSFESASIEFLSSSRDVEVVVTAAGS